MKNATNHRMSSRATVILMLCVGCFLAADAPKSAIQKVREGLQHFRNKKFSDAEASFTEAQELSPENAAILFDRACAAMAGSDAEQARGLLRSASLAKDASLAVKAYYNLGCLEAEVAQSKLGEDPAAAEGELREECVELLRASIRHYRGTIRLAREHKDARHNLELIRLYIKHLESQWAERDKQKNRQEKDLLQFLKMIEEQQKEIRSVTRSLDGEDSSVFLKQAALETADSLRSLREEIEPLKQKITQQIQQAAQQASPGQQPGSTATAPVVSEEMRQAEQALHGIADQIDDELLKAATELEATEFLAAAESQTNGLTNTNQLYMAIAPYQNVLQRALRQQQKLAPEEAPQNETDADERAETEASEDTVVAASSPDPLHGETAGEAPVDPELLVEQQTRITEWSSLLAMKAEAELPQAEQQLAGLRQAIPVEDADAANEPAKDEDDDIRIKIDPNLKTPASPKGEDSSEEAQKQQMQQQLQQMEGLVESMKLAVDKSPQAAEHSAAAVSALTSFETQTAEVEQEQTLRILKEIAEPLKSDQQDNQNQDQNQDDQQQDQQNKGQEKKDEQQEQQEQQDQQPQDEQQKQQEQKQSDRQQAESLLRQAAEREKRHREDKKKLRALMMNRIKVDKDW